ncbi:zf-HC2 domain-containing protein [Macrococcus epidermidis]|uniref:anti-sigma factor family protein n=1 Tax=Macrococcus epidermidis TaxID=1902580 RepID=UPI001EF38777|nr:zf-HC2 domain-containing protein [Macrococcus epidermidis]MCG7419835.1 zf-HC2 domain-containing protein [Macrococcus epidermidis]
MNHSLFKDLLPNYIDGLTSDETNELMNDHMNKCEACRALYERLQEDQLSEETDYQHQEAREFDALKKVKKSNKKKVMWSILGTLFVSLVLFGLYTYLYNTQWKTDSDNVNIQKIVKGNTTNLNLTPKNKNHFVLPSQEYYIKSKNRREYLIYESRQGLNDPVSLQKGIDIPITFLNKNTIINSDNEKEKIDEKDVIVLRFKDKEVKYKIMDLYKNAEK